MPAGAVIGAVAGGALGAGALGAGVASAVGGIAGGAALGGSIGSAFGSSDAASEAADAQVRAAENAAQVQWEMFKTQRNDMLPWLEEGERALSMLSSRLKPWQEKSLRRDFMGKFEASPDYRFRRNEAQRAIEGAAAARGGLYSGGTGKELARYASNLASQEYNDWWGRQYGAYSDYKNRLAGLAGVGQTASANLAGQAGQTGRNLSQIYQDIGTARASGIAGQQNAISGGLQNLLFSAGAFGGLGGLSGGGGGGGASTILPGAGNMLYTL